jgi:deoxycytidine triphosphate deaminase
MFLNREQILERMKKGELIIDPAPNEYQIGIFTVDLRLGTQW